MTRADTGQTPPTETHERVAAAYAAALRRAEQGSATGCGCGCGDGSEAQLVDYGKDAAAYADAVATSFGCGNPLAFSEVEPGQTVLDLGSGAGLDLLIAADRVGPAGRVIGVDMTEAMVQKARERIAAAGRPNIEVRRGLIEALPVDTASVDWVISNCVINLSPDKPAVFREVRRVLRPGGRLSISDMVVEQLPRWIRDSAAAYAACIAGAISEAEYVDGLRAAGLVDVEVSERLVYDDSQLREIVASELSAGAPVDPATLEAGIAAVSGKIWSAEFVGRRP